MSAASEIVGSLQTSRGSPGSLAGKESASRAGDPGSIPGSGKSTGEGVRYPHQYPWAGKIPWRRERVATPVFWPGEFHGLYSPWCHKELDMTE